MSGAKGQAAQKHSPAQAKTPDLRYVTERRMKSGKVYAYWIRRGYETVTLPGDKMDPKAQEIATELNNPAKGIPNIKTEPRQQVWSRKQEEQFLKNCNDDQMKLAFLLGPIPLSDKRTFSK